jgi:hypothetical protein
LTTQPLGTTGSASSPSIGRGRKLLLVQSKARLSHAPPQIAKSLSAPEPSPCIHARANRSRKGQVFQQQADAVRRNGAVYAEPSAKQQDAGRGSEGTGADLPGEAQCGEDLRSALTRRLCPLPSGFCLQASVPSLWLFCRAALQCCDAYMDVATRAARGLGGPAGRQGAALAKPPQLPELTLAPSLWTTELAGTRADRSAGKCPRVHDRVPVKHEEGACSAPPRGPHRYGLRLVRPLTCVAACVRWDCCSATGRGGPVRSGARAVVGASVLLASRTSSVAGRAQDFGCTNCRCARVVARDL